MSSAQNLLYATIQVAHNLGAVAIVGGSLSGVILKNPDTRKKLAWLALAGWGTQGLSGATFGAVSFYFDHELPDIGQTAMVALMIKMLCATVGLALLAAYLAWGTDWSNGKRNGTWHASATLGIVALSAAAVLRWYS